MTPNLREILPYFAELSKPRKPSCPHCLWKEPCPRFGFYKRNDPDQNGRKIKVQRFLCPNPKCEAVSFSVLPFRILPLVRMSVFFLWLLVVMFRQESVNQLARVFDCSRSTIRRRAAWGKHFIAWLSQPGLLAGIHSWAILCDLVYRAFFPKFRLEKCTNTTRPITDGQPIS